MSKFFDTDGVAIVEGSRLVWVSRYSNTNRTGIVFKSNSLFLVRVSLGESPLLQQVLDNSAWVMVVPAYPRSVLVDKAV